MKRSAGLIAFALVLSACAAQTADRPHGPDGSAEPAVSAAPHPSASKADHPRSPRAKPTGEPGRTPAAGAPMAQTYADAGAVGANALVYLRSNPATRLIVEVDYTAGKKPAQGALDHLESILVRETDKPRGVRVVLSDEMPSSGSATTFDELDRLEARYRSFHSSGALATIWIAYVDGQLAAAPDALGVSYRASTAAIFGEQIDGASSPPLVSPASIQRSVFTHEVGHLLGLVNIGYQSAHDHEDADHPHHSKYKDSVMYWAVEDVSIGSILRGGPVDDFDQYDKADLKALRAGS